MNYDDKYNLYSYLESFTFHRPFSFHFLFILFANRIEILGINHTHTYWYIQDTFPWTWTAFSIHFLWICVVQFNYRSIYVIRIKLQQNILFSSKYGFVINFCYSRLSRRRCRSWNKTFKFEITTLSSRSQWTTALSICMSLAKYVECCVTCDN